MDDRAGLRARDQSAVRHVGAVGEGLAKDAQPGIGGDEANDRAGQSEQSQRRVDGHDGVDDGTSLRFVHGDAVVQRPVRLDV